LRDRMFRVMGGFMVEAEADTLAHVIVAVYENMFSALLYISLN
jgi:hypothetical protein